jgi:hypothetical protein
MQEGTTSRTDFFSPRREGKPLLASLTVLRMPRSFAVISRISGQPLRARSFVHEFAHAGMPPQFRTSPNIRSLQVPSTPRFSIPLLSTFYPPNDFPSSFPPAQIHANYCHSLRKALPSLFLRTPLLGGNTIRLVSWNYATRDAVEPPCPHKYQPFEKSTRSRKV